MIIDTLDRLLTDVLTELAGFHRTACKGYTHLVLHVRLGPTFIWIVSLWVLIGFELSTAIVVANVDWAVLMALTMARSEDAHADP